MRAIARSGNDDLSDVENYSTAQSKSMPLIVRALSYFDGRLDMSERL